MSTKFWDNFTSIAGLIAVIAGAVNAVKPTQAGALVSAAAIAAIGYGSNKAGAPPKA